MLDNIHSHEDFDRNHPLNTDMAVWKGVQNWRIVLEVEAPPPNAIGLDVKWPCSIGRSVLQTKVQLDIDMIPFDGEFHGVSRRHAALLPHETGLILVDIGSTNGTWINGVCLDTGQQCLLKKGDTLEFGTLKATVRTLTRLDESHASGYNTIVTRSRSE
jgi:pSer/pThr/pTyr-binding forkhead associated (FHA) protein